MTTGDRWNKLFKRVEKEVGSCGALCYPDIIIDNYDMSKFCCEINKMEVGKVMVALLQTESHVQHEKEHAALFVMFRPYWLPPVVFFSDTYGETIELPKSIHNLIYVLNDHPGESIELVNGRPKETTVTADCNSYSMLWKDLRSWRNNDWLQQLFQLGENVATSSMVGNLLLEMRTAIPRADPSWTCSSSPFLPSNMHDSAFAKNTSHFFVTGEVEDIVNAASGDVFISCVQQPSGHSLAVEISFMAISKETNRLIWCSTTPQEDVISVPSFVEKFATYMGYSYEMSTIINDLQDSDTVASFSAPPGISNVRYLAQRPAVVEDVLRTLKDMLHPNIATTTGGWNDKPGVLHCYTDAAATQQTHSILSHVVKRAQSTEVEDNASDGDDDWSLDELDANDVSDDKWNPLMAARALLPTFVSLRSVQRISEAHLYAALYEPQLKEWSTNSAAPGVATTALLSEAFCLNFKEAYEAYCCDSVPKTRSSAIKSALPKTDTTIFEPTDTEDNKGRWDWKYAENVKYPPFDSKTRRERRVQQTAKMMDGKGREMQGLLAYLDVAARFSLTASSLVSSGSALKYGSKQCVFWDRTEVRTFDSEEATEPKFIEIDQGHFLVHFVMAKSCHIKFKLESKKKGMGKQNLRYLLGQRVL